MSGSTTQYRVLNVVITNIRNVSDLDIDFPPDEKVIYIVGPNGSGKSTVLHAPQAIFGGKAFLGQDPVKHGEKSGVVQVTMVDDEGVEYTAKMTVRAEGSVTVTIKRADGTIMKNPVATLKALAGQIGLNPVAFAGMTPAQRRQHILAMSDFDEDAHKDAVKALEDQRVQHSRDKKRLQGALDEAGGVPVDTPDEEVSMGDLMAEMNNAVMANIANTDIKSRVADARAKLASWANRVIGLEEELANAKQSQVDAQGSRDEAEAELEGAVDPDTEAIQERMNANQEINANVREKQRQDKLSGELSAADQAWDAKDDEIKALQRVKVAAFKAIDLPDGFEITDDDITVNGTAVDGLSGGEKVKAGVRLAVNDGRLRLVIIEDGMALDANSLKECVDIVVAAGRVALVEKIELPKEAVVSFEMFEGAVKE